MKHTKWRLILFLLALTGCKPPGKSAICEKKQQVRLASEITAFPEFAYKKLSGKLWEDSVELYIVSSKKMTSGTFTRNGKLFLLNSHLIDQKNQRIVFLLQNPSTNDLPDTLILLFNKNPAKAQIRLTEEEVNEEFSLNGELEQSKLDYQSGYDSVRLDRRRSAIFQLEHLISRTDPILDNLLSTYYEVPENLDWKSTQKRLSETYFKSLLAEINQVQNSKDVNQQVLKSINSERVVYNEKGFLNVLYLNSAVTNGIHDQEGFGGRCFDIINHKQLKLEDLMEVDSVEFSAVLGTNYRSQYNIQGNEPLSSSLIVDKINLTSNFYFNRNGLTFIYNAYEIASYAQGTIFINVPFTQFDKFLKPAFRRKMNLKSKK